MPVTHEVPAVAGVLTSAQVAQTAASIASMQEADGAVPWTVGEHVDVWNHVEGAMAMLVAGEVQAAEAASDLAVDEPVVLGGRLPAHAAQQADLLHAGEPRGAG